MRRDKNLSVEWSVARLAIKPVIRLSLSQTVIAIIKLTIIWREEVVKTKNEPNIAIQFKIKL